ncbi:hypothetical protein D3C81_2217130 [compost metagenome]
MVAEDHIAQGAAPQGGDDGDDQHAEQVHGLASGHQRASDGEDRDAEQVGQVEEFFHLQVRHLPGYAW